MNLFYWKKIGLDIPRFWGNILKMMPVPAVMLLAGLFARQYYTIRSWLIFFLLVAAYTVVYCAAMYGLAMNDYEKNLLLGKLKRTNV